MGLNRHTISTFVLMLKTYILFIVAIVFISFSGFGRDKHAKDTAMFKDAGDRIVLDNGIVSAIINKSGAHILRYKYKGIEVLKDGYYSMDGGAGYRQPAKCEVYLKTQTANLVDVVFKSKWTPELRPQAFDIECHYVIERGTPGIYCYALLSHPASYPKTGVGEWRFVWKLPQDTFDHIVVDSLRNMDTPSAADYAKAERTSIPEATKLTTGVKAGKYECKYEYSVEYYDVGTYGHTSSKNKIGAWMVLGGYDYFNDGPNKADLNAAAGIIHLHFGRNHYGGSGTRVEAGEQWSKIYGPFLLYMNGDKKGSDAMWADAKHQVAEEKAKWPYRWLSDVQEYPDATGRGSVSGEFVVKDPFKPNVTGAGAWIGLTAADADWEMDSKHYQYWVKVGANGYFDIPNVRAGKYTMHAYLAGEVGEFIQQDITVLPGKDIMKKTAFTWTIPRNNGKLIWEIGIPDRTAREFKFGQQYWNPFMWETYSPALPNPLIYTVGKSDWSKDWNYVQSAYWNKDGSFSKWPWKINFKLDKVPERGEATITFAFASVDRGRLETYVNDESKPFDTFTPTFNVGGNALVREGIHAKYSTYVLKVAVSKLHAGDNSIMLISNKGQNRTDHIMYDYISMELPQ